MSTKPQVLTHTRSTLNFKVLEIPIAAGKKWVIYLPNSILNDRTLVGLGGSVNVYMGQAVDYRTLHEIHGEDFPGRLSCEDRKCGCKKRPPAPRKRKHKPFTNTRKK